MFVMDPERHAIEWQGKTILSLIQSINQPMVAAADYPAEETQAYVITLQAADRSLSTYVYFHLQRSNRAVVYYYDQAPFMGDRLVEAETEAVDFVESMGFMMDNLRYDRLGKEEKEKLQGEVPIFFGTLKEFEPILRLRQKRADDPLATSDSGAPIEMQVENSGPTDEMDQSEVQDLMEEVVEVNDLSGLSQLSEDLKDQLEDSAAVPLPEPLAHARSSESPTPSKAPTLSPEDMLDRELAGAFTDLHDEVEEQDAPNLDATVVLPKTVPKPAQGMTDESLAAFFEPPAGGGDDLEALGEMEKRLQAKPPTTSPEATPMAPVAMPNVTEQDLKHLLSLFLSV